MVLGDTAGATCGRISFLGAVRAATAARTMRRSRRASVLSDRPDLVYGCENVPYTTAESSRHTTNILSPTCAAIHLIADDREK